LVDNMASQVGLPMEQLRDLISRGIIKHSETGTISFFHQTFFEHSAARAILDVYSDDALRVLEKRMSKGWSDLFCAPVYEQALLLSENMVGRSSQDADKQLASLLANDHLTGASSGRSEEHTSELQS